MPAFQDLCSSTFLQAVAATLIFIAVLMVLNRKRGKLPLEVAERYARQDTRATNNGRSSSTVESKAMLDKLQQAVVSLDPQRLSHLQFFESEDDTRIDDKKMVYLCLRDPATGKLYQWNDLIYVTLHEMAHALSEGFDPQHTSAEFQSNFWQLLRRAEAKGFYRPGEGLVHEYCALPIDKNDPGMLIR